MCDPDIAPAANDCTVDFLDLDFLRAAFFATPAIGNWNEDADLDGNGVVNFLDLNIMKTYFFAAPGPGASADCPT